MIERHRAPACDGCDARAQAFVRELVLELVGFREFEIAIKLARLGDLAGTGAARKLLYSPL